MKTTTLSAALLAAGMLALALAAPPPLAGPPRVTVIGDSVQESLRFSPHADAILGAGIDLRLEAAACRRLTGAGCIGGEPDSALSLIRRTGASLGRVAV